jgi:hypothetical protein
MRNGARRSNGRTGKEIMKARTLLFAIAISLLAALVLPLQLAAQPVRYKLFIVATPSQIIAFQGWSKLAA